MSGKTKRASAARVQPVGRIRELETENQGLRDALFAILRSQGRIRVSKADANALSRDDSMSVRDLGDAWLFEFQPSGMVTPNGVTNGKASEATTPADAG